MRRIFDIFDESQAGGDVDVGLNAISTSEAAADSSLRIPGVTEAVAFDEKIETPGGVLYIDGGSVLYLVGSTMDWVEDEFSAGFVFNNPNATGSCGCGESFTV